MTGNQHIETLGVDLLAPPIRVRPTDIPDLGDMAERERQCRITALHIATATFSPALTIDQYLNAARSVHAFIHEPTPAPAPPEAVEKGPSSPSDPPVAQGQPDGA